MPIASVDSQRRIYLPKGLGLDARKVIVIPQGDSFVIIPVPTEINPIDTNLPIKGLKQRAEQKARADAIGKGEDENHAP